MSKAPGSVAGALLVAGTSIGAGMLSLPVATAGGGLMPTLVAFISCWAAMVVSGLLMLEVSLWFPGEINILTMSRNTLGPGAAKLGFFTYVLFLYALMVAYIVGGVSLAFQLFFADSPLLHPPAWMMVGYTVLFGVIVYSGARLVDVINRWMMVGLLVVYVGLIILIRPSGVTDPVATHPEYLVAAIPLIITSFGFHLLIPSLKGYLQSNARNLRRAIIWGAVIPLVIYMVWIFVIASKVPTFGPYGLIAMSQHGEPLAQLMHTLEMAVGSSLVARGTAIFSVLALLTSFIGVALGLIDFFADSLPSLNNPNKRSVLAILTFGPPLIIALSFPEQFLQALGYAAIFAAMLLIIYPGLMALKGRKQFVSAPFRVAGGSWVPLGVISFGICVILVEVLHKLGALPQPIG